MQLLNDLKKKNLIQPPKWLIDNLAYMTETGSIAYGFATEFSDRDLVGFCIPTKEIIFRRNEIPGFLEETERFEQFLKHGVVDKDSGAKYDFTIYNIVKFFSLAMDNNPNIIELLYTPRNCIQHSTEVGELVRQNRKIFLHRGLFHKYKGYAYSQLGKINNQKKHVQAIRKFEDTYGISRHTTFDDVREEWEFRRTNPKCPRQNTFNTLWQLSQEQFEDYKDIFEKGLSEDDGSKRFYSRKLHNYDVKFLTHLVRLALQGEQLLETGELDLQRDRELLKDIRKGNWSEEQGRSWFEQKEKYLTKLYENCTILPMKPDTSRIKKLLLNALEIHYGNLSDCVVVKSQESELADAIRRIQEITNGIKL